MKKIFIILFLAAGFLIIAKPALADWTISNTSGKNVLHTPLFLNFNLHGSDCQVTAIYPLMVVLRSSLSSAFTASSTIFNQPPLGYCPPGGWLVYFSDAPMNILYDRADYYVWGGDKWHLNGQGAVIDMPFIVLPPTAKLTIIKVVINDDGGTKSISDFPLFVNGNPVISGVQNTFDAGVYTVNEMASLMYKSTFSGDCDNNGYVILNPGDVKSCAITNDDFGNFAILASENLEIEKEVQVSSGDLGSNKELNIDKDAIINGNLFADEITIDKNTQINGNVSFNRLKTQKNVKIFGTQTNSISLPIAELPAIPDFQIGDKDFKFEGENNTLAAGIYRDITLEKDGKLVLSGGTYNINQLFLKENSALIFSAPTILNIKKELKSQQHISVFPANNLTPTDLVINYAGKSDDLSVSNSSSFISHLLLDLRSFFSFKLNMASSKEKEKKEEKEKEKGNKPIEFGKDSFLNFKLLAPQAAVHIGESSTMRGQILARKVKVEKDSVLSSDIALSLQPKQKDIISTVEGARFVVNQII